VVLYDFTSVVDLVVSQNIAWEAGLPRTFHPAFCQP